MSSARIRRIFGRRGLLGKDWRGVGSASGCALSPPAGFVRRDPRRAAQDADRSRLFGAGLGNRCDRVSMAGNSANRRSTRVWAWRRPSTSQGHPSARRHRAVRRSGSAGGSQHLDRWSAAAARTRVLWAGPPAPISTTDRGDRTARFVRTPDPIGGACALGCWDADRAGIGETR